MIIGLTGGIASGKSTVAGFLRQAGASIIDADILAREVVQPQMPAWQEIRALFGPRITLPNGQIDRIAVGRMVFSDERLRRQLEAIVHPRVHHRLIEQTQHILAQTPHTVVVHDIPLLFETGMTQDLEEIVVVWVPPDLQLQRLMDRDRLDERQARKRIEAQMPLAEKRGLATRVIDNSGSLEATGQQVNSLYADLVGRIYQKR